MGCKNDFEEMGQSKVRRKLVEELAGWKQTEQSSEENHLTKWSEKKNGLEER